MEMEKLLKKHAKIKGFDSVQDFQEYMNYFSRKMDELDEDSEFNALMVWKEDDGTKKGLIALIGEKP